MKSTHCRRHFTWRSHISRTAFHKSRQGFISLKKALAFASAFFWRRWRISVCVFPEEKQRYLPVFALADEHPAGVFDIDSNLSIPHQKTTACHPADCYFWRRWRDSNSRRAFDPYTISNRARSTNYATSPCLLKKTNYQLVSLHIIIHMCRKVKEYFSILRERLF